MSKWFKVEDIGRIQLELTNYCNAGCPMCDRYEINKLQKDGLGGDFKLNTNSLLLSQIKKTFGMYEWPALDMVHFCGCLDEPTINPEMIEITKFFLGLNDKLSVAIATNGGTRSDEFWAELGRLSKEQDGRVIAIFGIDGLKENNHLYRRNVNWDRLERNFRSYISNGGLAVWKCIIFPYNSHMLDEIRDVSVREGFSNFILIKTGRSSDILSDDDAKNLSFNDDQFEIPKWYDMDSKYSKVLLDVQDKKLEMPRVRCIAKPNSMDDRFHLNKANIYIDYMGQMVPCCWTGNPFGLREMQEKAFRERGIDKSTHNISNHTLQEILDGPFWDFIHDDFENNRMCVNKCRKRLGDVWL